MTFSKTVLEPSENNSPLKSGRLHQKRVSFQDEPKKQAPKEFLKRKSQRAFPLPVTPRMNKLKSIVKQINVQNTIIEEKYDDPTIKKEIREYINTKTEKNVSEELKKNSHIS